MFGSSDCSDETGAPRDNFCVLIRKTPSARNAEHSVAQVGISNSLSGDVGMTDGTTTIIRPLVEDVQSAAFLVTSHELPTHIHGYRSIDRKAAALTTSRSFFGPSASAD